ncbi:SDR family oxidoreductase [Terasakiella sp. SH-1]|uniref:UDP-glucose 4-epimerase family protein n=1 Tax=Terasakiella sp. SH-1 TaxID=2560057 RepID=UPI001073A3FD|nr:SDR family oxidoreductase [Terasakiella sp. SH-1]
MTRVLVTGATGFVGSRLCQFLNEQSISVRGSTRRPPHTHNQKIEYINIGDINNDTNWQDALKNIDIVVHCAARVHIMNDIADNPLEEFRKTNVEGTRQLADQAAQHGVKRFIFLSSIKVNGESSSPNFPFKNSDRPHTEDPYGQSKWEAEQALNAIAAKSNMEVCIIRPSLIYGPGVKANFKRLQNLATKGWPVPFGSLNNLRSYVFIDNLCDCIKICLTHPQAANQTFLISDGHDLSVRQLYEKLCFAQGHKAKLINIPAKWMELIAKVLGKQDQVGRLTQYLQVDSTPLQSKLGWQPPVSVDQAIELSCSAPKKEA